jgi:hypothetical protein
MIIKGGSRAGPVQLAAHLQRRDTNERVEILDLQSPTGNLTEAFRDWQTLCEGTRGTKGLYHANIDPAIGYTMTPEQWKRAVDVLEHELGFDGQPRAVVLHEKHGRQHIHVVWQRTDIQTMTLKSDSENYPAHERASLRLELEFGHDRVPGKHAKRNRKKQPEFPRSEVTHAEWQQAERTDLKPAERKELITKLKQESDNAQAFKSALDEHGFILAKGDRRAFVIVDHDGEIYGLTRQIQGMTEAKLREFLTSVDREKLPTADQAVQMQQHLKPLPDPPLPDKPEPQLEPQPSKEEISPTIDRELEAIKKAWAEREAKEASKLLSLQTFALQRETERLDQKKWDYAAPLLDRHTRERNDMLFRHSRQTAGIWRYINAVMLRWAPEQAVAKSLKRRQEMESLKRRQERELKDQLVLLDQNKQEELDAMKERQEKQVKEREKQSQKDLERHIREYENARQLIAEIVERDKMRDQKRTRDGPDMPPPPTR